MAKPEKPERPYEGYPLFPHLTGRWAKKIKGHLRYFGPWRDPMAALERYNFERPFWESGRIPPKRTNATTVKLLCNAFLTSKSRLVESGELSIRMLADYRSVTDRVMRCFGGDYPVEDLTPAEFERLRSEFAKTCGPVAMANLVNRTRILFKFGFDAELIDKPVRFGATFKLPSRKVLREARNERPSRFIDAKDIRACIEAAPNVRIKAAILLGINCGFGNHDIAKLTFKAVDLDAAMVSFPRPKTAVQRRCPLWPETVEAMRLYLKKKRGRWGDDTTHFFLSKYGNSMGRSLSEKSWTDAVGHEFAKILKKLGIKKPGVNFYALRHTFATIGGDSRDQVAVDFIMGHAPESDDMASVYRQKVFDERLLAVTSYVRTWLFSAAPSHWVHRPPTD